MRIDHLMKMTEHTVEKLIPAVGERIDFLQNLELFKSSTSEQVNIKHIL